MIYGNDPKGYYVRGDETSEKRYYNPLDKDSRIGAKNKAKEDSLKEVPKRRRRKK